MLVARMQRRHTATRSERDRQSKGEAPIDVEALHGRSREEMLCWGKAICPNVSAAPSCRMRRIVALYTIFGLSCGGNAEAERKPASAVVELVKPSDFASKHSSFERYWYQGQAELGRYELDQMRYGQARKGHAVLVFVTEDFRFDKQVKYEGGEKENVGSVLKLNAHRRFDTGIYPYSILTSSFSPADEIERPLKVTASVQEWCGHTFSQLNGTNTGYHFQLFSYFDSEGDEDVALESSLTEDGLWAIGRRDPNALPVGKVEILPALHVLRFRHAEARAQSAVATLKEVDRSPHSMSNQVRYEVAYNSFGRRLVIYFETAFPHRPLAWEEFDESEGETSRTFAVRREEMMLDYWNHNGVEDAPYRKVLGL